MMGIYLRLLEWLKFSLESIKKEGAIDGEIEMRFYNVLFIYGK